MLSCQDLVVGSGAGGSVAAARLAEAGRDVIVLEEGGHHGTSAYSSEVGRMTSRLYRNGGAFPFLGVPTIAFTEGRCVGGGTVINGGLIWRTPPWVLEEWQERHRLHEFSPEALKPCFEAVEHDLHVREHVLATERDLDSLRLMEGARKLGWSCVMAPRAVRECIGENFCSTGCLSGAKQSALQTYIPRALHAGARIFAETRADRIVHRGGRAYTLLARGVDGAQEFRFERLVLAAGAIHTPHLLRRSGLSRRAGTSLRFHLNLKVVAIFDEEIHAERGTIFTTQVQEFAREGILICASSLRPAYLGATLSHLGPTVVDRVFRAYARTALYVAMTRPRSRAHVVSALGSDPLVWYRFDRRDLRETKEALRRTAEVLFAAGARELYLPISNSGSVSRIDEVMRLLENLQPRQLELLTVHVMASCPIARSAKEGVIDPEGRLFGTPNVLLCDASMLPSSLGESPQGTIMALAHRILDMSLGEQRA
jgi:choline dehydrogenase-like flavoprotein